MSGKTLREAAVVVTDADVQSVWNAQFVDLGGAQIESIKAAIAAVVARHLADSADAPEGPLERFEHEAEAFQQATGFMCPGKDVPAAMNPSDDYTRERELSWKAWVAGYRYYALNRLDAQQKEG